MREVLSIMPCDGMRHALRSSSSVRELCFVVVLLFILFETCCSVVMVLIPIGVIVLVVV